MDVSVQYLTFKISYAKFLDYLLVHDHSTRKHEYFDGCFNKMYHILSILWGFNIALDFLVFSNGTIFM